MAIKFLLTLSFYPKVKKIRPKPLSSHHFAQGFFMTDTPSTTIDYVVYTFDKSEQSGKKPPLSWKRHSVFNDEKCALNTAKDLFHSQKYTRIEVKKRFFAPRKNRQIYATIKVLKSSIFRNFMNFIDFFIKN